MEVIDFGSIKRFVLPDDWLADNELNTGFNEDALHSSACADGR